MSEELNINELYELDRISSEDEFILLDKSINQVDGISVEGIVSKISIGKLSRFVNPYVTQGATGQKENEVKRRGGSGERGQKGEHGFQGLIGQKGAKGSTGHCW